MIIKQSLAKSSGIEFGKKWSSPPSTCKGVLDWRYFIHDYSGDHKRSDAYRNFLSKPQLLSMA